MEVQNKQSQRIMVWILWRVNVFKVGNKGLKISLYEWTELRKQFLASVEPDMDNSWKLGKDERAVCRPVAPAVPILLFPLMMYQLILLNEYKMHILERLSLWISNLVRFKQLANTFNPESESLESSRLIDVSSFASLIDSIKSRPQPKVKFESTNIQINQICGLLKLERMRVPQELIDKSYLIIAVCL